MWVDFVQPEGETSAVVTLSADACDVENGKATFMENRIVKTGEPDLEEKYVANETFEYVEQGAYGIFNPERSADGVPHLSETHEPYTNDTISGDWSLKLYGHYGQGDVTVRTSPATMRLKPNTEYEMEFDTLGGGKVYVQSESEASNQVLNESFAKGHSTFNFATEDKEDYIVRIERGSVLDNFTVKEIGPAGTTIKIPGKVEVEDYLNMEGLTVVDGDDGKVLSDINSGDWAEYRVRVSAEDYYKADFRVNIPAGEVAQFELALDGEKVKTITLPSTNGTWETVTCKIHLPDSGKELRVTALTEDFQMNWIDFDYDTTLASYKIQAEDFTNQQGTQVDSVEDPTDDSKQGLGYIEDGDWMEYEVEIEKPGTYRVDYRISVNGQGSDKKVGFAVNEENVKETILPDTGGWQNWTTVSDTVEIKEAGTQTIRLNVIEGKWNINWFKLTEVPKETVDKSELSAYYETYKDTKNDGYTEASWKAFQESLAQAKTVLDNESATQEEVNTATQLLKDTKAGLVKGVDKTNLTALIDYAKSQQSKEEYKYVVLIVKEKFEKALADAERINAKADATQEEVDAVYAELLKMVHHLDFTGNSESLKVLVDAAKGLNEKLYTEDSWNVLKDALAKAEGVLADENALQEEIDAAKDALQNAMDNLVKIPVDKSKLEKLVNDSKKYEDKIDEYTPSTAEIFTGALKYARDILAKEDATQEEVNAAYNALQNAIFGLRLTPNKDKLDELIKEAEKTDFSKYTEESGNAVKSALKQAKAVFKDENATEKEVAKAEKDLKAAMDGLKVVSNDGNTAGTDNKGNGTTKDTNKKAAKTGDDDLLELYGALAALAAAGVIFKKNKK